VSPGSVTGEDEMDDDDNFDFWGGAHFDSDVDPPDWNIPRSNPSEEDEEGKEGDKAFVR